MDVVLITERYAESILLMRKKLCMNLLDLFVPPKKVHSHDEFQFSDKQKENFYKFQSLDLHMYNVRLLISSGPPCTKSCTVQPVLTVLLEQRRKTRGKSGPLVPVFTEFTSV